MPKLPLSLLVLSRKQTLTRQSYLWWRYIALLFSLCGLLLLPAMASTAAVLSSPQIAVAAPPQAATAASTQSADQSAPTKRLHDRFAVAGTNQHAVSQFLLQLQHACHLNSTKLILPLLATPLRINLNAQHHLLLTTTQSKLKQWQMLMNKGLKKIILQQDALHLFVNSQGVMLGNGAIWFRPSGPDQSQALQIFVINPPA